MIRTALVLANLTGRKVEDGVASLLSSTDVQKAASKAEATESREIKQVIQDPWQTVEAASSVDACIKPLVRMSLKLTAMVKKAENGIFMHQSRTKV